MNELDTRLRGLTELSPPSRSPLGADELHQRASRNQRRAVVLRAVPAAMIVVVLLAGAMALRSRDTGSEITVTNPDTPATTSTGLSERDQEMLSFLVTAADLRHELNRESVLTAVYGGSSRTSSADELGAQRVVTDDAMSRYRQAVTAARPGEESPALAEAITQADNRLSRIDTLRRSVDDAASKIYDILEGYANTVTAVGQVPIQFLQGVEQPALFRGVLTASNYGTLADLEAATASSLTVAVEVGFFPFTLDLIGSGPSRTGSGVAGCGEDAQAAGSQCPAFAEPLQRQTDTDQAAMTFETFANPNQKMLARAASAGNRYDELRRAAFNDGVGQNDLRGTTPLSRAIDPTEWRAAALEHIDRMADVERQLYAMIGTEASAPDPGSPDAGSAPGTIPASSGSPGTVPEPSVGSGSLDGEDDGSRTPSAVGTQPATPNERAVDLEPNATDSP